MGRPQGLRIRLIALLASLIVVTAVAAGCSGQVGAGQARVVGYEGATCGLGSDNSVVYPKGRRDECARALKALSTIQSQKAQLPEREYLERLLAVLDGPDAQAALAASAMPRMLGELRSKVATRLKEITR